jgi:hypothetical protein
MADTPQFDPSSLWREGETPTVGAADAVRSVRHARFRLLLHGFVELAIPLAAVALVGLAIRHASTPSERVLGAFTSFGVVFAWVTYLRAIGLERRALAEPSPGFVSAALNRCRYERRLAIFTWIILLLELAFLVPWWIGGLPYHRGQPLGELFFLTLWLPLALIIALSVWSVLLWRRASREAVELGQTAAELRQDR